MVDTHTGLRSEAPDRTSVRGTFTFREVFTSGATHTSPVRWPQIEL